MITRTKSSRRRGGALVASLICVVLVSGLGAALIQMHIAASNQQQQFLDNKRAFYIAEAGLAEAFMAVAQGKTGNVGTSEEPADFADGLFWVEAEEGADNMVILECTGLVGRGRYCVAAIMQRDVNPVASLGVFGDSHMTVGTGTIIDGYDSRIGTFDTQVDEALRIGSTGHGARVNGNAEINFDTGAPSATRVYGNVNPGPDGAVLADANILITGSTAPNTKTSELPSIDVPDITSSGSLQYTQTSQPLTLTGEVHYEQLTASPGTTIHLVGPATVVIGALGVTSSASLVFDATAGPVTLICTDMAKLQTGSNISCTTENPQDTAFLISAEDADWSAAETLRSSVIDGSPPPTAAGGAGPGGGESLARDGEGRSATELRMPMEDTERSVVINAAGIFHGLIYAPLVDLALPASLRVYGAVSARRIELAAQSRVSFDKALAYSGIGSVFIPSLESWRIIELPQVPIVQSRRDPWVTLKLQGNTSKSSPLAHLEKNIDITYIDLAGVVRSYSGVATALDWSQIKTVQTKQWEGARLVQGDLLNATLITDVGAIEEVDLLLSAFGSGMTSTQLQSHLSANSPLAASVLIAAMRSSEMTTADLRQVVDDNFPLSAVELYNAVDDASNMSNADLIAVLNAHGGLPASAVTQLLRRRSAIPTAALATILVNSSPLTPSVLAFINGGGAGFSRAQLAAIAASN
jgi:hypothetical protein